MSRKIKLTSLLCAFLMVFTLTLSSCDISFSDPVVMSLNDIEITKGMMSYFYMETLVKFTENYSSYAAYFGYDTTEDPKLQEFDDTATMIFHPSENCETWFDYFMSETITSLKTTLVYCAEAEKLGVALNETDNEKIDKAIETLLTTIHDSSKSGFTDSSCLKNVFGKGVNKKDIRKAMELSLLASKAEEKISNNIDANITDEEIDSTYNENVLEFNLVDYFSYSFTVDYEDVIDEVYGKDKNSDNLSYEEKEVVRELYKEKIEQARESAKVLSSKKTLNDFCAFVIDYSANANYDEFFNSTTSKLTSDELPKTKDLETIKEKIIASVIKEVSEGQEKATEESLREEFDGFILYDITVNEKFAEAAKTLKNKLFDTVKYDQDNGLITKANYISPDSDGEKDDFSEWAFSSDRKINDINCFESGDGANGEELDITYERFSVDVAMLLKTSYRDEEFMPNIAYMLFDSNTDAQNAIEAIKSIQNLDKDKFLSLADTYNATKKDYVTNCSYLPIDCYFDIYTWFSNANPGDFTLTPYSGNPIDKSDDKKLNSISEYVKVNYAIAATAITIAPFNPVGTTPITITKNTTAEVLDGKITYITNTGENVAVVNKFGDYTSGNIEAGVTVVDKYSVGTNGGTMILTPSFNLYSDNYYVVAYYASEGDNTYWKQTVRSYIHDNDYEAYEEKMNSEFSINIIIDHEKINSISK